MRTHTCTHVHMHTHAHMCLHAAQVERRRRKPCPTFQLVPRLRADTLSWGPQGREEGEVSGQAVETGTLHPEKSGPWSPVKVTETPEQESNRQLLGGGMKPQKLDTHFCRTGLLSWGHAREDPAPHLCPAADRCPQSPAAGCLGSPWPYWVRGRSWVKLRLGSWLMLEANAGRGPRWVWMEGGSRSRLPLGSGFSLEVSVGLKHSWVLSLLGDCSAGSAMARSPPPALLWTQPPPTPPSGPRCP